MNERKVCEYYSCLRSKKFYELCEEFILKDSHNKKLYHFISEILNDCAHAELDAGWGKAIFDGTWPSEYERLSCWKIRLEKLCAYFNSFPDHDRPVETLFAHFMLDDLISRYPKIFEEKKCEVS